MFVGLISTFSVWPLIGVIDQIFPRYHLPLKDSKTEIEIEIDKTTKGGPLREEV